jgi:hyperosmotically inducible periplasmic protein
MACLVEALGIACMSAVNGLTRKPSGNVMIGCLLAVFLMAEGCGGARPYSQMYKSASSELSAPAQARDHRLKANLRAALIAEQGLAGLTLSPDVVMEHGFVIGRVDTFEQANAVRRVAANVAGLRSLDVYLPLPESHPDADSTTISDMTIHTEIAATLRVTPGIVASRINVTVVGQRALLVGVVSGEDERRRVVKAVSAVEGVKGVTNWLLLPEPDYMTVRPRFR